MGRRTPIIVDLNAELAKLTMFHGLTPLTPRAERQGSGAVIGPYREGILFAGKFAGTTHWEDHPEDELVHVVAGSKTLDIVSDDGAPQSFALRAGMMFIVPKGAWHRFRSDEGGVTWSATIPGDHVEADVADPRSVAPRKVAPHGAPIIIDFTAEVAKLTMFRDRTPQSTMADRAGSAARLAPYRDGGLSITKFAGRGHWEAHLAGDELIYIVDGTATLDMLGEDGPRSFPLHAGMLAVNPQGAWHRFQSAEGVTLMAVTPAPGDMIEQDVDDPRAVRPELM
jgi:mannose-6-phosphate isomerase-like protein (cupin superfamily)